MENEILGYIRVRGRVPRGEIYEKFGFKAYDVLQKLVKEKAIVRVIDRDEVYYMAVYAKKNVKLSQPPRYYEPGDVACIFYRKTYLGFRCVLMSPEEWNMVKANRINVCASAKGRGCPLLYKILNNNVKFKGDSP